MTTDQQQQQIAIWRRRSAASPNSRIFAPLADSLRLAGQHTEALTLLEEGIVQHPNFQAAMVILGHTLLDADRSEHARKVLKRVLETDPDNVVVLRLLTEEARSRQAWDDVVPLLVRLSKLDPDDERWPQGLLEAKSNRRRPDPTNVPETSFATMTLVEIYLAQGYLGKAMTALRQMQVREPERLDIRDKIREIALMDIAANTAAGARPEQFSDRADRPGDLPDRRSVLAAKRSEEKKNFEAWISRIRTDERSAP